MSYPINEFVTDHERLAKNVDEWISSSAGAVETALNRAGDDLSSALKRGKDLYKAAGKRVGMEAYAANAVLHRNPYPTVLFGICAGALVGFLVMRRLNGRCG
jgi:ElaB/YqjD/DUF883 family membrane-anchored ribosome-binding protein